MNKRKMILALIKLTRYREYLIFVTITTLLGFIFSAAIPTTTNLFKFCIVLIANMLSVCFSFMINDVEDAPDDALSPKKITRNPISAGILSRKAGLLTSAGIAILAAFSFLPLGIIPVLLGWLTIGLGFVYSWKSVRLKSIPILDLISHSLMLAALQFLSSYFTFSSFHGFTPDLVLPLLLVTSVSMYGELYNEVRDFTYDKMAGITHTATLVGKSNTHLLMYILLSIAGGSILYSIFLGMIPVWFIIVFIILGGVFFLHVLSAIVINRPVHNTDDVQDYILIVTVISLSIWVIARIAGM